MPAAPTVECSDRRAGKIETSSGALGAKAQLTYLIPYCSEVLLGFPRERPNLVD
jgi:hypothetical protein